MRPLLPQSGFKLCCTCFVCSALASTGPMLTAATTLPWKTKSLWKSHAAAQLLDHPRQCYGLTQLSLPEPTPERKYFSTSWYSQTGLEVFIAGLFDNCQFHSLLIIFVPWNYRKPFLFLFNFIPFQSFYHFSHSRWQGSLSQTEIHRNALQKKCFYWGWKTQLSRQKSVRRQFPMRVSAALWVNIEVLKPFHNCITS